MQGKYSVYKNKKSSFNALRVTLGFKRAAEASNLPPSSALAAWGKRKASKHPQSHMNKSIFPPRMRGGITCFPPLFSLFVWHGAPVQSPLFLSPPTVYIYFKRNTTNVQHPLWMPGLDSQRCPTTLRRLLFFCVVSQYDTASSLVETDQCDLRKCLWNQRKLEFKRIFIVAKSISVRAVKTRMGNKTRCTRVTQFQIK